jgi:hypothetical protein
MKKNALLTFLVLSNIVLLLLLGRMAWLSMLWKDEATSNARFAAGLWAANDIHKGKKVKLRLKVEDEPKGSVSEPTEFDGDFVVREWIGYTDPFPILGGQNSPSIQTTRIIVDTYNKAMREYHAAPEKYKQRLADEIRYWNENVLGNKNDSSKPRAGDGK